MAVRDATRFAGWGKTTGRFGLETPIQQTKKDGDFYVTEERILLKTIQTKNSKKNMSRSYKKHPFCVQEKVTRTDKRIRSRSFRRKSIGYALKGSQYKKMPPYVGWKQRWTFEEAVKWNKEYGFFTNEKELRSYWEHCCLRK